jgi:hypothetical protein
MYYLGTCYAYGYGVPRDLVKSRQLHIMGTGIAERRALRVDRQQQEERERFAREFARRIVENAASPSTYRSTRTKPQQFKGPLILTPCGIKPRTPFTAVWDP